MEEGGLGAEGYEGQDLCVRGGQHESGRGQTRLEQSWMHTWGKVRHRHQRGPMRQRRQAGASEQKLARVSVYVMQLLCAMTSESASPPGKWGRGGVMSSELAHAVMVRQGGRRETCNHAVTWLVQG